MSAPAQELKGRRNVSGSRGAAAGIDTIPPDSSRLVDALRQIGYSFEQAISDLVDNSISAGATTVLIRFVHDREEIRSIAVADDGCGMNATELENAMRFGSQERESLFSLGKFGMGLKLASLSYAKNLTVFSRKGPTAVGRRWTLEGICNNWHCERLGAADASFMCKSAWSPIRPETLGTLVLWDDIDKLPVSRNGLRQTLRGLHRRLDMHLGLYFHRFLERGDLRIFIDQQVQEESEKQIRVEVQPLDPFGYEQSGDRNYPKVFTANILDFGCVEIEGHIWPPNSELPEYRLGGRAAARQGFYFYRNDRLIQAGGWNGLMQNESEPHSSLARVKIDLSPDFDDTFSLNVQKSSVIVPPGFCDAVRAAKCKQGTTFDFYRHLAEQIYRSSDQRAQKLKTFVPKGGIPKSLQKTFTEVRGLEEDELRSFDFAWEAMNDDILFSVDREKYRILLNANYRLEMLAGFDPEENDMPLLKLMIYHLLEQDLKKSRTSSVREKELLKMNRILVAAAKMIKG